MSAGRRRAASNLVVPGDKLERRRAHEYPLGNSVSLLATVQRRVLRWEESAAGDRAAPAVAVGRRHELTVRAS